MVRQVLYAAVAAGWMAGAAHAATITYTLQVDDGGAGKWSLYADASGGGGISDFCINLNNPLLTSANLVAPRITFFDSTGTNSDNVLVGFTKAREVWVEDTIWGAGGHQDITGSTLTPPTARLIYGFGQAPGNLAADFPPGYDRTSGAVQVNYAAHLKLASGTYDTSLPHTTVRNWFADGGGNFAFLFTAPGSTVNALTPLRLVVVGPDIPRINTDSVSYSVASNPDLTVHVQRLGAGSYLPTITLVNNGNGLNWGEANIVNPITEVPIWIMAQITGADATDVLAVLPNQTATTAEVADLHAQFDALFPDGSFNAVFKFTNPTAARSFKWDMTGWDARITALAAVPEPASLGLLALGALGLLARPRNRAKQAKR